jgi:hypothetical protein
MDVIAGMAGYCDRAPLDRVDELPVVAANSVNFPTIFPQ